MSGKDDPFGGRTVIIPNPGGAAETRSGRARCRRWRRPRGAIAAGQIAGAFGAPQPEDWLTPRPQMRPPPAGGASPSRPPQPERRIPLEVALNASNTAEFSAANPITQAAAPLLILLGRLRLHIVDMQAVPLMNYVAQAITEFEKKIVAAGVNPQEALVAKYVAVRHRRRHRPEPARHRPRRLDAVLDAGAVLPGAHLRRRLLRGTEQGARQSGAALQSARAHACLPAARLRGPVSRRPWRRQRTAAHPPRRLPDAAPRQGAHRRRDFAALARHDAAHAAIWRTRVPLWAIASGAGMVLVGVFFLLRFLLGNDADALADRLVALHPGGRSPSPGRSSRPTSRRGRAGNRRSWSASVRRWPTRSRPAAWPSSRSATRSWCASATWCCLPRARPTPRRNSSRPAPRSPPRWTRSPARST